jgi:molybdenum cofactor biosynthesis enzyme MoaA
LENILKNFCALPFHHLTVKTNGDYNICCQHRVPKTKAKNINYFSHDDWVESEYLNKVRDSFINDQRHPGCQHCWQGEDAGFVSYRQRIEKEYRILGVDTNNPSIKNVEVDLGNLCNLKCLMCFETESSAILAENTRLKINQHNQSDFKWEDTAFDNLKRILDLGPQIINIRGGEPFYNSKLLEIVENIDQDRAKKMVLHITTNATLWNAKWREALSKFRLVRIMASVDAVDDVYEYIRYPAKWAEVKKNILEMSKVSNIKLLIHAVAQNLNISSIDALIEWCLENKLYLEFDNIIHPAYLSMTNLPDYQKKQAIDRLSVLLRNQYPLHISKFIENSIKVLSTTPFDPILWQNFHTNISLRDQIRGNSYRDFIKECL